MAPNSELEKKVHQEHRSHLWKGYLALSQGIVAATLPLYFVGSIPSEMGGNRSRIKVSLDKSQNLAGGLGVSRLLKKNNLEKWDVFDLIPHLVLLHSIWRARGERGINFLYEVAKNALLVKKEVSKHVEENGEIVRSLKEMGFCEGLGEFICGTFPKVATEVFGDVSVKSASGLIGDCFLAAHLGGWQLGQENKLVRIYLDIVEEALRVLSSGMVLGERALKARVSLALLHNPVAMGHHLEKVRRTDFLVHDKLSNGLTPGTFVLGLYHVIQTKLIGIPWIKEVSSIPSVVSGVFLVGKEKHLEEYRRGRFLREWETLPSNLNGEELAIENTNLWFEEVGGRIKIDGTTLSEMALSALAGFEVYRGKEEKEHHEYYGSIDLVGNKFLKEEGDKKGIALIGKASLREVVEHAFRWTPENLMKVLKEELGMEEEETLNVRVAYSSTSLSWEDPLEANIICTNEEGNKGFRIRISVDREKMAEAYKSGRRDGLIGLLKAIKEGARTTFFSKLTFFSYDKKTGIGVGGADGVYEEPEAGFSLYKKFSSSPYNDGTDVAYELGHRLVPVTIRDDLIPIANVYYGHKIKNKDKAKGAAFRLMLAKQISKSIEEILPNGDNKLPPPFLYRGVVEKMERLVESGTMCLGGTEVFFFEEVIESLLKENGSVLPRMPGDETGVWKPVFFYYSVEAHEEMSPGDFGQLKRILDGIEESSMTMEELATEMSEVVIRSAIGSDRKAYRGKRVIKYPSLVIVYRNIKNGSFRNLVINALNYKALKEKEV